MDFYGIIKKINELRNELGQVSLSAIERDIIKTKIAETYLLLAEETADVPIPTKVTNAEISGNNAEREEIAGQARNDGLARNDGRKDGLEHHDGLGHHDGKQQIDYKSLVDTFLEKEPAKPTATDDKSLLSKMSQTKITDLKRSIAMNDRFIFIKELFKNDFDAYNRYINAFNECQSMEQAEEYLVQLKNQYEWDEENETVQHFLSLIGRRFR